MIENEVEKMEKTINYYVEKDPNDDKALFKGILAY